MTEHAQAWLDAHVSPRRQTFIRVLAVLIPTSVWVVVWWPAAVVFVGLSALVLWA